MICVPERHRTVSIGLVALSVEDESLDTVMRRADLAMYQAKEGGRNQVITVAWKISGSGGAREVF